MLDGYKTILAQKGEVYLKIKARPGAAATAVKRILQDSDGEIIKIDIAAPAVKNKANLELIKFLARFTYNPVKYIYSNCKHEPLKTETHFWKEN